MQEQNVRSRTVRIRAFAVSAGVALLLPLAGCGGGEAAKPTNGKTDGAYLRVAQDVRGITATIDRATEKPPHRPPELAREFRSFQKEVGYEATFLRTVSGAGPVADAAFTLRHSLLGYEAALRAVATHANGGDRPRERAFQDVRRAGVEVRTTAATWERALAEDSAG